MFFMIYIRKKKKIIGLEIVKYIDNVRSRQKPNIRKSKTRKKKY